MNRTTRIAVLFLVAPLALAAQKAIVGMSGNVFRYHGDTIWMERDTTLMQSITHGDTVEQLMSVNGVLKSHTTFVVRGDSAWIVRAGAKVHQAVPASVVGFLYKLLETELQNADTQVRLQGLPTFSRMTPPASPEAPRSYTVSSSVHITQHRDTVAYIRGCTGAHTDTTLFLMIGPDSVKRISSPERVFGQAMAVSLASQMRLSLMQEFTAGIRAPLPADLPKAPGSCPPQP